MGFFKSHRRAVLVMLAVSVLAGADFLYFLKTSKAAFAAEARAAVKEFVNPSRLSSRSGQTKGPADARQTVYVDGAVGAMPDRLEGHDVKAWYETAGGSVFCDYTTGFSVSLPAGMTPDITKSPAFVSFNSPNAKVAVSREWTYDKDVSGYIGTYFFSYLLDGSYRSKNGIELLKRTKNNDVERLTVRLNGCPGKFDTYTYLIFKTDSQSFYYAMLKYSHENRDADRLVRRVFTSFRYFMPEGAAKYTTDFRPVIPDNWNPDTRALYNKLRSAGRPTWGIFTKDVTTAGIAETIPALEKRLDYKFGIILAYTGLDGAFPTEFMQRCSEEGRIVELTLQTTERDNLDLYEHSPWLELYKSGDDARIRAFARAARAFGKPFLFRLNNEMNSNWVIYGGVLNLLDPDIFVENWRTVYRIFQEEGVDNAIWIFNPNDRDAPPHVWNSQAAYYPGNGYVQIYGITGYNNGTYYQETTREGWREFDEIYSRIQQDSGGLFGAFPWMITEFASSSIGGDKAKWIDGMFDNIGKYPNIKAAVWFSYADYDPSKKGTVSRPYWLDETDATVEAFKRGLAGLCKMKNTRLRS
jgi:hypothetical protein